MLDESLFYIIMLWISEYMIRSTKLQTSGLPVISSIFVNAF